MKDLVVATPVFLDLTFVGLESLPALGEERFAAELLRSPGGGAITAVAAARLGLSTAARRRAGDQQGSEGCPDDPCRDAKLTAVALALGYRIGLVLNPLVAKL